MAAKPPLPGWTTPADLRAWSMRAWNSGDLLRGTSALTAPLPRRRPLRHPTASQLRTDYARAVAWAATWNPAPRGCRLEYVTVGANTIGANTLPAAALFVSPADEISFLGLGREAARFADLAERLAALDTALAPWAQRRPLELVRHGEDALTGARVALWLTANPAPRIYLRQLTLPGVHTKFVETHRRLIDDMMATLVPERPLAGKNYARRHGFVAAPDRVRLRFLDPLQAPAGMTDLGVTAAEFSALA